MPFRSFLTKAGQHSNLTLALIGGVSFVLYIFLSRRGFANEPNRITETLHRFFTLLAALFLLLLFAAMLVKQSAESKDNRHWSLIIIVAFAALFRVALLAQTPWLSNDIYRYWWDAQLVDHGVNPYAFPPAADELARFRDTTLYPKMDHKTVHSVYPPVLQLLFWLGRKTSQVFNLQFFAGLKLIFVLIDLGLVLVLFRLLSQQNLDPRWAVLYAWHPLPIIEIAGSGHTDGAGALTLILALAFLAQRKYIGATIFLALGFLVKFISILFLPFLLVAAWKVWGVKKAGLTGALFVALIVVSYAPFVTAGQKLISGLVVYSDKWRFNDGFFSLVFTGIHRSLPDGLVKYLMIPSSWVINTETLTTRRIDLALIISKIICGGIFTFVYIRLWWRIYKLENLHRLHSTWDMIFITVLGAFFLLSPTLQPWYLIWLLPLLCFNEMIGEFKIFKNIIISLWLLSATVFLSYFVLENYIQTGVWQEPAWVKWVEYGLPLLVGLWISKENRATELKT